MEGARGVSAAARDVGGYRFMGFVNAVAVDILVTGDLVALGHVHPTCAPFQVVGIRQAGQDRLDVVRQPIVIGIRQADDGPAGEERGVKPTIRADGHQSRHGTRMGGEIPDGETGRHRQARRSSIRGWQHQTGGGWFGNQRQVNGRPAGSLHLGQAHEEEDDHCSQADEPGEQGSIFHIYL